MQYAFPSWELCEACHRRRDSSRVGSTVQSELAQSFAADVGWWYSRRCDYCWWRGSSWWQGTDAGVGEHGHLTADDGIANMGWYNAVVKMMSCASEEAVDRDWCCAITLGWRTGREYRRSGRAQPSQRVLTWPWCRQPVGRSSKPLEDGARGIGESCCRACRDRQRVTEDEKKKKKCFGETHNEKKRVAYQLVLYYSDKDGESGCIIFFFSLKFSDVFLEVYFFCWWYIVWLGLVGHTQNEQHDDGNSNEWLKRLVCVSLYGCGIYYKSV